MGSCSQFCLILHPQRTVWMYTFSTPFHRTDFETFATMIFEFVQMFKSTKSCRTDLLKVKFGITPEKGCKMTQVGGWGHLMVQINLLRGSHRFSLNFQENVVKYRFGLKRCSCLVTDWGRGKVFVRTYPGALASRPSDVSNLPHPRVNKSLRAMRFRFTLLL